MPTQGLPCSLAVVLESPDTQELTWRLAVCVCVCVLVCTFSNYCGFLFEVSYFAAVIKVLLIVIHIP